MPSALSCARFSRLSRCSGDLKYSVRVRWYTCFFTYESIDALIVASATYPWPDALVTGSRLRVGSPLFHFPGLALRLFPGLPPLLAGLALPPLLPPALRDRGAAPCRFLALKR
mgnify:CR=1 FL=1